MSTAAQQEANAANAQHSTGPQTEAGKSASSQNARKHGLSSTDLFIPEPERPDFDELEAGLLAEIQPQGALESEAMRHLISAAWKLRRIARMETEILQNEPNPLLDEKTAKALDRLLRYHTAAERTYRRTLQELKDLQTNRCLHVYDPDYQIQALPVLVSVEKTKRTQRVSATLAQSADRNPKPSGRSPRY